VTRRTSYSGLLACVAACLSPMSAVRAAEPDADWLQWGGPTRDFHVPAKGLAETWPDFGPRQLWKRPLGDGYSAVLARDGKLFTLYRPAAKQEAVVCLDAKTGETVWEDKYSITPWADADRSFGEGPNATPLLAGDRLIAVGISGQLRCLEAATGKLLWAKDLPAEYGRAKRKEEYGFTGTPVRAGKAVVIAVGGEKHAVVALAPTTGRQLWTSDRYDGASYAAPVLATLAGREQVVFMTPTEVVGINAGSGKHLWRHSCKNKYENNCTSPLVWPDDHLWVATQMDGGTRLLKLTRDGDGVAVQEVWNNPKVKVFHWNVVRIRDHVYGSFGGSASSLLGAVEWKTGKFAWDQRGLHAATGLYADGKWLLLDSNGQLALATVSPKGIDILSSAQVTDRVSWRAPTLVGTSLYVRDRKHVLALDLAAGK
jgi:outer membrane protein assembly factor BamB